MRPYRFVCRPRPEEKTSAELRLPMSHGNRAMGRRLMARQMATFHCERTAGSRPAKLISQASASSPSLPVAHLRIDAIKATGGCVTRARMCGHVLRFVSCLAGHWPSPRTSRGNRNGSKKIFGRAFEDQGLELLVGLEHIQKDF